MIGKIDANQIPLDPGSSPGQPNTAGPLPENNADVSVQVNYAFLIEKALQQPETDAQAIQQARNLILSGQLDSPENIRSAAAEKILGDATLNDLHPRARRVMDGIKKAALLR